MFNVVELTKQMVAINTVSDLSNLELAELIKIWFEKLRFDVELQKQESIHGPMIKTNLIARIGPNHEALMFSGHMDTVPVEDINDWDTDPFTPILCQDKLFGLGSVDMKGSIAAMICAVEPLAKERLKREIIFGLTFDEEIGLVGAKYLVESQAVKPKFTIIGEPTMMKPMRMHKGHIYLEVICRGSGGHASDPEKGINAIEIASEAIRVITQFADELKAYPFPNMDPPYATVNIGTINGGKKSNMIATKCLIGFDIRPIPGMNSKSLIRDIEGRLKDIAVPQGQPPISIKITKIPTEPVLTDPLSEIVLTAEKVTGIRAGGVAYGTDGSVLQNMGTEIIILGPGSINQAHKPNEFVTIDQLELAVRQFREITQQICMKGEVL